MNYYKAFIFPLISQFDAEFVHDKTIQLLEYSQRSSIGQRILSAIRGGIPNRTIRLFGLEFPNEIGVAAGFDKDARVVKGLSLLGFGHVEVGTLTPKLQLGNPKPRIHRVIQDKAIINRMGFPNCGVDQAAKRLKRLLEAKPKCIIGVSIGKQKETPLTEAWKDYQMVMAAVYDLADYFAVNISSPNTPGLRNLQAKEYLTSLMKGLAKANHQLSQLSNTPLRPLLVKIAPDLTWKELDELLEVLLNHSVDGIIATNTTISRHGVASPLANECGGLSGQPLRARSTEVITYINSRTEGRVPIIAAGGVFGVRDVEEKLEAGASLVQLYTGLVYEGPGIAGRLVRGL